MLREKTKYVIDMNMNISDLIGAVCAKHSISQGELAKKLGYNRITLWKYATGRLVPRPVVVDSLERLLAKRAKK